MKLTIGRWYAWQSVRRGPYAPFLATPILVTRICPLKTGKSELEVELIRLIAPVRAVQERQTWRVGYRSPGMLAATPVDGSMTGSELVVTELTFQWLKQVQPHVARRFDSSWVFNDDEGQVQDYMGWHFGANAEEVLRGATKRDYDGDLPVASSLQRVNFQRRYKSLDAWLLLRGLKPKSSDDKWFIHVDWDSPESGLLSFRRSWTGYLIWQVSFWVDESGVRTDAVHVNVDRRQHLLGTPSKELAHLDSVIGTLLLGDAAVLFEGLRQQADGADLEAAGREMRTSLPGL